ncbi:MAG: site-specific integrase [Cyanothece sp. SIO1E1]|nr:site-specific integrase [Cyanothece sp. SIO1E1]
MPKTDRKGQAEVLSQDQLDQLWIELDQPHRIITQLAYYTASRIGEVCQLRAEDIRAGKVVITQTKTGKTKEVVIVPQLEQAIVQAGLPTKGYLFPSAKWTRATVKRYRIDRSQTPIGDKRYHFNLVRESAGPRPHISARAVDKALRRTCELLGLEGVSTHSFRRSLATHLYDAGVPLRQIMEITGHATLASLTSYLDVDKRAAGDALMGFFAG